MTPTLEQVLTPVYLDMHTRRGTLNTHHLRRCIEALAARRAGGGIVLPRDAQYVLAAAEQLGHTREWVETLFKLSVDQRRARDPGSIVF